MKNNKKYDEKILSRTQEIKLEMDRYQIMIDYFNENPDRVSPNSDYLVDANRLAQKLNSELDILIESELDTLIKLQKRKC